MMSGCSLVALKDVNVHLQPEVVLVVAVFSLSASYSSDFYEMVITAVIDD